MTAERLQKLLAAAGVASRRHAEALILAGRVRVDGQIVAELGARANPERQRIDVDGRPLRFPTRHAYLVLHKPPGYVTTAHDPEGRPTIFDLLPPERRLVSAGRLDWDSEGLLLATDDGELVYRLTHPRYDVEKEYHLWTEEPTARQLGALAEGVDLEEGPTAPARVRPLGWSADGFVLAVAIHEGRNRQVRRMAAAVGLPVYRLVRVRIGPLQLGRLSPGRWRALAAEEVAWVRRAVGLPARDATGASNADAGRRDHRH